jgi:hypothetical protein
LIGHERTLSNTLEPPGTLMSAQQLSIPFSHGYVAITPGVLQSTQSLLLDSPDGKAA